MHKETLVSILRYHPQMKTYMFPLRDVPFVFAKLGPTLDLLPFHYLPAGTQLHSTRGARSQDRSFYLHMSSPDFARGTPPLQISAI